jgi:hypothetical protein
MFPWVTASCLGELALLSCCFLEAQDNRWLSLISVLLITLFCQLTRRTSEKGSKGRTLETLDLPKDGLVLSDHSQVPGEAQAKADPGVWCSWDLYKEQRPCLSLDLPALVIHM